MRQTVTLVYWASGSGIEKDVRILSNLLAAKGFRVKKVVTRNRASRMERILKFLLQIPRLLFRRSVQLHIEQIHREQFHFARKNILLPNPEMTDRNVFHRMPRLPEVFCKSHHAVRLFEEAGLRTCFVGFTSEDRRMIEVKKDFKNFLHVAGASNFKGTRLLAEVWSRHPEWPKLRIVRTLQDCYGNPRASIPGKDNLEVIEEWLPEQELKRMQNACGVHLCLSEMEGFGHYILEAMSAGNIVITTDAPPMNELIDEHSGFLVAAHQKGNSFMSERWQVDPEALEQAIERLLAMSISERESMGCAARKRYEEIDEAFKCRFSHALSELTSH